VVCRDTERCGGGGGGVLLLNLRIVLGRGGVDMLFAVGFGVGGDDDDMVCCLIVKGNSWCVFVGIGVEFFLPRCMCVRLFTCSMLRWFVFKKT